MVQQGKAPAIKPDDLNSVFGTHTMKERTSSPKLSFDLHMNQSLPSPQNQAINVILKVTEKRKVLNIKKKRFNNVLGNSLFGLYGAYGVYNFLSTYSMPDVCLIY